MIDDKIKAKLFNLSYLNLDDRYTVRWLLGRRIAQALAAELPFQMYPEKMNMTLYDYPVDIEYRDEYSIKLIVEI